MSSEEVRVEESIYFRYPSNGGVAADQGRVSVDPAFLRVKDLAKKTSKKGDGMSGDRSGPIGEGKSIRKPEDVLKSIHAKPGQVVIFAEASILREPFVAKHKNVEKEFVAVVKPSPIAELPEPNPFHTITYLTHNNELAPPTISESDEIARKFAKKLRFVDARAEGTTSAYHFPTSGPS